MISWVTPQLAIGEFSDAVNMELIKKERAGTILFLGNEKEFSEICKAARNSHVFLRHAPVVVDYDEKKDIAWEGEKFTFSDRLNLEMQQLLELAFCKLSFIQFGSNYTEKTLVCCVAGIDRSPFVVAKYLVEKVKSLWIDEKNQFFGCDGKTTHFYFRMMSDAYSYIKLRRPSIIEHYEWVWWKE